MWSGYGLLELNVAKEQSSQPSGSGGGDVKNSTFLVFKIGPQDWPNIILGKAANTSHHHMNTVLSISDCVNVLVLQCVSQTDM